MVAIVVQFLLLLFACKVVLFQCKYFFLCLCVCFVFCLVFLYSMPSSGVCKRFTLYKYFIIIVIIIISVCVCVCVCVCMHAYVCAFHFTCSNKDLFGSLMLSCVYLVDRATRVIFLQ